MPQQQTVPVHVEPTLLDTPTGMVVVWGQEYVSKRMMEILGIMLSHDAFENVYHGVKSVVFRTDGYPKESDKSICATFAPDTGSIAINMEKTLERAMDRSMDHPETSLLASWWMEMLLNFGHEIHHGVRWETSREKLYSNNEALAEEEELADKYSDSIIADLVKEYDLETPSIEEETWFNSQIIELFTGKEETDKWVIAQKEMITNGWLWKHENKDGAPIMIYTFKDLICLLSEGNIEAAEWNKPTIQINSGAVTLDEQLNGKKVTIDTAGVIAEEVIPVIMTPVQQEADNQYYDDVLCDEDYTNYTAEPDVQPVAQPVMQPVAQPAAQQEFNFNSTLQQTEPVVQEIPGVQYDMATISRITQQVYMKVYNFIFTSCEPQRESDVGFSKPEAVLTTPIPLTAEEASIFTSMNHNDINGRWCPNVATTNGLLGKVMKNTKLPAYELTLNVNGVSYRRLLIPQNPAKVKNGQLTQRAVEARAGNAIAYIIDQDDNTNSKYGPYIINGAYNLPRSG